MAEQFIQKPGEDPVTLGSSGYETLQDAANQGYSPVAAPNVTPTVNEVTENTTGQTEPVIEETIPSTNLTDPEPQVNIVEPGQHITNEDDLTNFGEGDTVKLTDGRIFRRNLDGPGGEREKLSEFVQLYGTPSDNGTGPSWQQYHDYVYAGTTDATPINIGADDAGGVDPNADIDGSSTTDETVNPKNTIDEMEDEIQTEIDEFMENFGEAQDEAKEEQKIDEKSKAITDAQTAAADLKTIVDKMNLDLDAQIAQDILDKEVQRNAPISMSHINTALANMSVKDQAEATLAKLRIGAKSIEYNNALVKVSIAQGAYDRAMDLVRDTTDLWKTQKMMQIDFLGDKLGWAKEEKEARRQETLRIANLQQQGFVPITSAEDMNKIVKDNNVTAETWGNYFYKDPINGKTYMRPGVGSEDKNQVLNMMSKYVDAGILPTDTVAQATAKLSNSGIYRRETYIPGSGSGSGAARTRRVGSETITETGDTFADTVTYLDSLRRQGLLTDTSFDEQLISLADAVGETINPAARNDPDHPDYGRYQYYTERLNIGLENIGGGNPLQGDGIKTEEQSGNTLLGSEPDETFVSTVSGFFDEETEEGGELGEIPESIGGIYGAQSVPEMLGMIAREFPSASRQIEKGLLRKNITALKETLTYIKEFFRGVTK